MASANCKISPIFEYDVSPCPPMQTTQQTSPFGCCTVPCTENDCNPCGTEYEIPNPEGMWICPDGFEPDWQSRLCEITAYSSLFACASAGQLESWWNTIQCLLGDGCWPCRQTVEMTLLQHYAFVETKWINAYETALVAGAIRGTGNIRPVVSLSGGLSGAVNSAELHFTLSPFGLSYLALKQTQKKGITGAYSAVPRGSGRSNLRAMTGVY